MRLSWPRRNQRMGRSTGGEVTHLRIARPAADPGFLGDDADDCKLEEDRIWTVLRSPRGRDTASAARGERR